MSQSSSLFLLECSRKKAAAPTRNPAADSGGSHDSSKSAQTRAQTRTSRQVPEYSIDPLTRSELLSTVDAGAYNRDHGVMDVLYQGDFVHTETLTDLRICRDYLLGKLLRVYVFFFNIPMTMYFSRRQ